MEFGVAEAQVVSSDAVVVRLVSNQMNRLDVEEGRDQRCDRHTATESVCHCLQVQIVGVCEGVEPPSVFEDFFALAVEFEHPVEH